MIRNAASQDTVAFLGILEPRNWPACLQHLVLALDSPDSETREVSFAFHLFFQRGSPFPGGIF
jgi:transportin-1